MLKYSKNPLDPSQFLRHLKIILIKSGKTDFNIFCQQDAGEILSYILNEFCSHSPHVQQALNYSLQNEITCNTCMETNINEETSSILQLPVSETVQRSLSDSLKSEELSGDSSYYCNRCSAYKTAFAEHSFAKVGEYLIIHLKRFNNEGSNISKNIQKVVCTPDLVVPVVHNDIKLQIKYRLLATINHTGSLQRGHYTSFINSGGSDKWFFCNDAAILDSPKARVNNSSSYICFYEKCK